MYFCSMFTLGFDSNQSWLSREWCFGSIITQCFLKVDALADHSDPLAEAVAEIALQVCVPSSQIKVAEATDFINQQKAGLKDIDSDIKDAKRRIQAHKKAMGLIKPKTGSSWGFWGWRLWLRRERIAVNTDGCPCTANPRDEKNNYLDVWCTLCFTWEKDQLWFMFDGNATLVTYIYWLVFRSLTLRSSCLKLS